MHILLDSQVMLRRYLTLFYGFTLGLALALAYLAFSQRLELPPGTPSLTQVALASTLSPTLEVTPIQKGTPTAVPAIPPTPDEKTPSSLGVSSGELHGLKVTLWHPWSGTAGMRLDTILAEFNRTNRWGVNVETKAFEGFGALDEAVETALVSGTAPGIVVDYGYQARLWDASDALVDLTPYIDDPVWGLTADEQANFYPVFWEEDVDRARRSAQAHRLGVPYYRAAYVLFYNQSWGRELDFPNPPTTPENFRAQACAAAEAVAGESDASALGKGGWLATAQPGELLGWVFAFGGKVTGAGAAGYSFATPEVKQALTYLKGLQESGCAWFDPQADPQAEFANRGALFIVGSLIDIPAQQDALMQAGSSDKWVVIPFPSNRTPVIPTYGPSLLVTHSTPPEQLAAWLVIEWLLYPPNQAGWVETLTAYPTRMNTSIYLAEANIKNPQWAQALGLISYARSEPTLASWGVLRWALQDASAQLFDPQFTSDQIPSLLNNLDSLASEVATQEP